MRGKLKSVLCGALCATTAVLAAPVGVSAGPASLAGQESVGLSAPVDHVYYRRYYRHGYRYGYRPGYRYGYYDPAGAAVAGAALGLVGAGVAAAAAPRYYGYPGYGWGW
jgi:hypothetical protein